METRVDTGRDRDSLVGVQRLGLLDLSLRVMADSGGKRSTERPVMSVAQIMDWTWKQGQQLTVMPTNLEYLSVFLLGVATRRKG
jgi:hypothetical protein